MFTGASPFAQEQEILLGIINSLDHFDVAGRVVGRQEVLGIHHGHESAYKGTDGSQGAPGGEPADAGNQADGRGVSGGNTRASVRGVARAAEGEDRSVLGDGAGRGQEGHRELVALAREEAAVAIEDAARAAGYDVTPEAARIVRASVRQVRADKIAAYAKTVSKNAKAWIKRQTKALDARMAEAGYTEKVWHGTGAGQFQVFRLATRDDGVNSIGGFGDDGIKMAFFSYYEQTARNYAALSSFDINTDYETLTEGAKPDARE